MTPELYNQAIHELGSQDLSSVRESAWDRFATRIIPNNPSKENFQQDKIRINTYGVTNSKTIVGETAYLLAEQDDKFTLIAADCAKRINVSKLIKSHPEKFLEVGISEQNMICMASAMANEGFHVFAAAYAPFLTARALDQIRVNLGYMNAPVCLVGLSSGLVASDCGYS